MQRPAAWWRRAAMRDHPKLAEARAAHERTNLFGPLEADVLARELGRAANGPLQGQCVGLKANIAVNGAVWSGGLEHRADLVADSDAHVVRRLRTAGARLLPGLNMDPAALGGTTDNPAFGCTKNPHAPEYSVGGSSGGSAAAIAAGLVEMALGTDTLGSVRIPASYCGVYGLKPTFGLIGRSGVLPLAPSLDTLGPLTARAGDLWPLLEVLAGYDPVDPATRPAPADWGMGLLEGHLQGLRIGAPKQIGQVECEAEVLVAVSHARRALQDAGALVVDVDMPGWHPSALRKMAFLLTEAEGAVTLADALQRSVLPTATAQLLQFGARMGAQKLVATFEEIGTAQAQLDRTFAEIDLLLMPTTPQRAFRVDQTAPANQADFTALANCGGIPAVAVPVWGSSSPLPASVQIVGPRWSERRLVDVAVILERAL